MEITGPAAGHPRLQTAADPSGRRVQEAFKRLINEKQGLDPGATVFQLGGILAERHRREHAQARDHEPDRDDQQRLLDRADLFSSP